jgi:hypothetical protein
MGRLFVFAVRGSRSASAALSLRLYRGGSFGRFLLTALLIMLKVPHEAGALLDGAKSQSRQVVGWPPSPPGLFTVSCRRAPWVRGSSVVSVARVQ